MFAKSPRLPPHPQTHRLDFAALADFGEAVVAVLNLKEHTTPTQPMSFEAGWRVSIWFCMYIYIYIHINVLTYIQMIYIYMYTLHHVKNRETERSMCVQFIPLRFRLSPALSRCGGSKRSFVLFQPLMASKFGTIFSETGFVEANISPKWFPKKWWEHNVLSTSSTFLNSKLYHWINLQKLGYLNEFSHQPDLFYRLQLVGTPTIGPRWLPTKHLTARSNWYWALAPIWYLLRKEYRQISPQWHPKKGLPSVASVKV